ncbi:MULTISPECIES: Hpt domain-containing protein [unclassified Pseudarthrobacter]|uniref:Hpt domain-containing protein n=1 Tax=unclassified Pseudarthrobacter TaxID=2647000 RepID=UPI0011302BEA|nr:Hpt domain-containing protein [Pseudarthrobacter sp. NIBRBAC000502772]QDG68025.1 Hpt domain-containing protein [Pseudarthrobacter sp. NIBRBAC000502772]
MAPDEGNGLPLLDPDVLDRLRTELEDDDGVWKVFVQNFIEYLPHRTEKLRLTLTTGDLAGAMDAVLSLKTSSQMVGAERLAGLAMELEQALRHETLHSEPARVLPRLAADRLRQIIRCARQTTNILQKYLHSG